MGSKRWGAIMRASTTAMVDDPRLMSAPPKSNMRLWVALVGVVLYGGFVLLATMWPTPLDRGYESSIAKLLDVLHRNGVPEWFGYSKLEFTANIGMFVPLGFLLTLALPRRAMRSAIIVIPALSAAVELLQATFLAERFASVLDVFANSVGGYGGAVAAVAVRAAVSARDRKVVARALWNERTNGRPLTPGSGV